MPIKVYRHGRATGSRGDQSLGDAVVVVESRGENSKNHLLWIGFHAERGTGKSDYDMLIEPSSFRGLAEAMIRANREEAIKAFGTALQLDSPEPMEFGRGWVAPRAA